MRGHFLGIRLKRVKLYSMFTDLAFCSFQIFWVFILPIWPNYATVFL